MANTVNNNLILLPTGAIDWLAAFNSNMNKLEVGRTLKLTAGEALAVRECFYIKSDGKAWKTNAITEVVGVWQSTSTDAEAEGYGQIGGTMSYASWIWTPGDKLYSASDGSLSTTQTPYMIGYAVSATEIRITPNLYNIETLMTTASDPLTNAACTTAIVDSYAGTIITLSTTGNSQTIQSPTNTAAGKIFTVVNNDTSTHSIPIVANSVTFTVTPGEAQSFIWDGNAWGPTDIGITAIPVIVTQGGTGLASITDHGIMLGSGTDPVTPMSVGTNGQLVKGVTSSDPIWSTTVLTDGTNTFNLTNGTAALDIAAGATLNIDKSLTVDGQATTITGVGQANTLTLNESLTVGDGYSGTLTYSVASKTLTVEDSAVVSQDYSSDASPAWITVKLSGLTDNYFPKHTSDATGLENSLLYQATNSLLWGDTSNAKNTYGFTINQLAANDEIISLKSSDVAHGMTDQTETDTYGLLRKVTGDAGGLDIMGLSDGDSQGMRIFGIVGATDPTDTTAAIEIYGAKRNTTNAQAMGAAETVFKLKNWTTNMLSVLGSGNLILGTSTATGTSLAKGLMIDSGTAPTTSPADAAQVWVADHNGQAGYARLHERTEDGKSAPIALLSELETYKNPLAYAQGLYTTDSTTVAGPSVADNANIDNPTNNFAVFYNVRLADWTPSATTYFVDKHGLDTKGVRFVVLTDGKLFLRLTSTITATSTVATGLTDGTTAQVGAIVTRETASTAGSVIFTVNGVQLGDAVPITAGATADISNAESLYLAYSSNDGSSIRYAEVISSCIMYNRALTAAEVLSLYRHGIDYADKWGSQTSIITGNDSTFAGASNWANVNIAAFDSTGDLTITANAAGQYCTLPVANATTVAGKKYRLKLDVANLVSTWTIKDFTGTQTIGTISADGTGQSIEFTASTTGGIRIVSVANNSSADIDNVYLYPIGATLALEGEGIQRDGWKDSSTNGLNASYPASGYSFLRHMPIGQEVLLSTTTVSLAADADTTLYTVPTGRRCVPTKAIIVVGADAGTSVISIGQNGAETDFLPNNTLSALDAANDAAILMPVPNTTPTLIKSYAGGTVIEAKVSSHAGGATNTVYLFGFLY